MPRLPIVWIIGRTKTDGPSDYDAVHKVQAGLKVTPLSQWGKEAAPIKFEVDPKIDMKTPPKIQVDTMAIGPYLARAAELTKSIPPHLTDQATIARLKRIGFEYGKSFDLDKVDPTIRDALTDVPESAQSLMKWKTATLATVVNGWSMNTDTMGVYGNYYLKRAIVAQQGLGANQPEDAIYPLNLGDKDGRPLDGANAYTLHFEKRRYSAGRRVLVGDALRQRGFPGRQSAQPVRSQQLDAVQIQRRRFTRPLLPER